MGRHSQIGEHKVILNLLGNSPTGFYIDVGCNQPFHDSVSSYFYDMGWSGICIDANERITSEFKRQRPRDTVVNCGVGDQEGQFVYHDFGGGGGLNTFDVNVAEEVLGMGYVADKKTLQIKTLTSILDEHEIPQINFLKIDVEGLDFSVLKGLDLNKYTPNLILYEYGSLKKLNINEDCHQYLVENGYKLVYDDTLNYYYIRKDFKS